MGASDMMIVADFAASGPAEIFLRIIRVGDEGRRHDDRVDRRSAVNQNGKRKVARIGVGGPFRAAHRPAAASPPTWRELLDCRG